MRQVWAVALVLGIGAVAGHAQDGAESPSVAAESSTERGVVPLSDLESARNAAKSSDRPLVVLAVPDWFESEAEKELARRLADADPAGPWSRVVVVLLRETTEREVHRRHRVEAGAYPLAVVLSSEGSFLGALAGRHAAVEGEDWADAVLAVPERRSRVEELRERLEREPDDLEAHFELAQLWLRLGERGRARPLLERLAREDTLDRTGRLGEARFLLLRQDVHDQLAAGRFEEVEGRTLRWLRRFSEHARALRVRLLRANALYLSGRHEDARDLWQALAEDDADAAVAGEARAALDGLKSD